MTSAENEDRIAYERNKTLASNPKLSWAQADSEARYRIAAEDRMAALRDAVKDLTWEDISHPEDTEVTISEDGYMSTAYSGEGALDFDEDGNPYDFDAMLSKWESDRAEQNALKAAEDANGPVRQRIMGLTDLSIEDAYALIPPGLDPAIAKRRALAVNDYNTVADVVRMYPEPQKPSAPSKQSQATQEPQVDPELVYGGKLRDINPAWPAYLKEGIERENAYYRAKHGGDK